MVAHCIAVFFVGGINFIHAFLLKGNSESE